MNNYKNYVDMLRNILKNFDSDKFNYVIKNILSTVFDDYYMNRNNKIYCIDNLYIKYDISRYNFIKKKYGVVKNKNLIFRFNKYSKKYYIIKLLKDNFRVILDEDEIYESVANKILKNNNIKNYKKYIDNMYIEKYFAYLNSKKEDDFKEDDFEIKIVKKICFHPPCLTEVIGNNYCHLPNKDMI